MGRAQARPWVPSGLVALLMFGTKPGSCEGQCSGLPAPWYLSVTPGALPFVPPQEAHVPQREQIEVWETPPGTLFQGQNSGRGLDG